MSNGIRCVIPDERFITLLFVFTLSQIANGFSAQPLHENNRFCRSTAAFSHHLATYNEEKIWLGSSGPNTYEIYSSKDGLRANKVTRKDATWTVAYTASDGRKCLVATGVWWEDSLNAHVQKVPVWRNAEGLSHHEPENSRANVESDFVILNARLKLVGRCKNGYSLDEVVAKNPYVIGKGTVEEASDHVNEYTMSTHNPDYLFVLSSAPNGRETKSATWAILYPLPVVDRDLTFWGCTYIEAVGIRGQKLRAKLRAKDRSRH